MKPGLLPLNSCLKGLGWLITSSENALPQHDLRVMPRAWVIRAELRVISFCHKTGPCFKAIASHHKIKSKLLTCTIYPHPALCWHLHLQWEALACCTPAMLVFCLFFEYTKLVPSLVAFAPVIPSAWNFLPSSSHSWFLVSLKSQLNCHLFREALPDHSP